MTIDQGGMDDLSLPTPTWQELRQFIESFIQERLQGKLDKLHPDEDDKRQTLLATHRREAWLADAARRVGQLQLVTHTLKPIHPDARGSPAQPAASTRATRPRRFP